MEKPLNSKIKIPKIQKFDLSRYVSLLSVVILFVFFGIMNNNFLGLDNISDLLTDIGPLLVISCGVTFVLLLGSIDLGIGSICSFSCVLFVVVGPKVGYLAYIICIAYGIFAGWINGVIHVKGQIPSFIVTLGAQSVWQSAAYLLSGGQPLLLAPKYLYLISIFQVQIGIISMTLVIALLIVAIFYIVQEKTVIGKSAFAIGANERAARIAGINIEAVKIILFTICGLCSALAGIFLVAKLGSGIPDVGVTFNLMGVAAAVLGGTALTGGKGSVLGAILGSALIIVIQDGLNVIGVDSLWNQVCFGALVIGAVALTVDRSRRDLITK